MGYLGLPFLSEKNRSDGLRSCHYPPGGGLSSGLSRPPFCI
eukprot:NODE_10998_length_270_cov_43.819005_g9228_i0.p1 GENE.NODE_10998_length_270_cov_43.819005_g9228_i0~~NODE_10998_length_270_cov_43.819005_g9228_i0.p1  ORF type:complete len:51 (-),score=6.24 NODE_10998_length_270_cov_43.819005_g9228_i0:117-239(-)